MDNQTDWFSVAQAAVSAGRELSAETFPVRVEAHRLRDLNQGKDYQIEALQTANENQRNEILRMRNRMKFLIDIIEFTKKNIEVADEYRSVVKNVLGDSVMRSIMDFDFEEARKECGCGGETESE